MIKNQNYWGSVEHTAYKISTIQRYHLGASDFYIMGYDDCAKLRKFNIIEEPLFELWNLEGARSFKIDIKGEGEKILSINGKEKKMELVGKELGSCIVWRKRLESE